MKKYFVIVGVIGLVFAVSKVSAWGFGHPKDVTLEPSTQVQTSIHHGNTYHTCNAYCEHANTAIDAYHYPHQYNGYHQKGGCHHR